MDVHPIKNVSIGIDPYPYLRLKNMVCGRFSLDYTSLYINPN
jgi:hypothetical protein